MGVVKTDIFKKDREWNIVNLSTPESVKGLLKHRRQFDLLFDRNISSIDIHTTEIDLMKMTNEVICVYVWLDSIMKRMRFTQQQKKILNRFIAGYSEDEIAKEDNQTVRNVNKIINTICKNVTEEAKLDWLRVMLIKKGLKTKICRVCERVLPIVDEFFSSNDGAKDGYRNTCKSCR